MLFDPRVPDGVDSGRHAVLDAVDHRNRMFDPQTDGKGLQLQRDSRTLQHAVGVTGTVTGSQDEVIAGNFAAILETASRHPAVRCHQPGQARFEA